MDYLTISLSDAHYEILEAGVSEGIHASVEDYALALIDADSRRLAQQQPQSAARATD